MNNEKVYLKGYVVGHSADTLGYKGLQIQLENMDIVEVDKNLVYKITGEPKKVTVPQFVADWIEYFKNCKGTLYGSTNPFSYYGRAILEDFEGDYEEVLRWIRDNSDTYARAWLDGYEVEKEKQYRVKMKGVDSRTNYLYYGIGSKTWLFKPKLIDGLFRKNHTRKELEQAGFGEVFNSPLFEVEEVD